MELGLHIIGSPITDCAALFILLQAVSKLLSNSEFMGDSIKYRSSLRFTAFGPCPPFHLFKRPSFLALYFLGKGVESRHTLAGAL
jgi:hypothetical protein